MADYKEENVKGFMQLFDFLVKFIAKIRELFNQIASQLSLKLG